MDLLISGKLYLPERLRQSIYKLKYISKDDIIFIYRVCVSKGIPVKYNLINKFVFEQGGIPEKHRKAYEITVAYIRRKNKFTLNFISYADAL